VHIFSFQDVQSRPGGEGQCDKACECRRGREGWGANEGRRRPGLAHGDEKCESARLDSAARCTPLDGCEWIQCEMWFTAYV
jgi:hypothetical protein